MNKRMLSLLAAMMLGLSVTACGQDSSTKPQSETAETIEEKITVEESSSIAGKTGMDAALLGVWSSYDTVTDDYNQFIFSDDGTVAIRVNNFEAKASYTVTDDVLHMEFISGDAFETQDMKYAVAEDTLVLTRDNNEALTLNKGAFEVVKSSTAETKASAASETKAPEIKAVKYIPVSGDLVKLMNNGTLNLSAASVESIPSEDGAALDMLAVRLLMQNTSAKNISVVVIERNFSGNTSGEQVYSAYENLVPGTTYKTTLAPDFGTLTDKIAYPLTGNETYTVTVITLPEGEDVDAAAMSYFENGQVANAISVTDVNINLSAFTQE